jgi:GrpB-like predicted nucleotidyltransferase (UPF0157 family)
MSDVFRLQPPPPDLPRERDRAIAAVRAVAPHAEVFEVGSTAIEGVVGKQDIDLLVRVALEDFERTRALLDGAFERDAQQLSNELYQGYRVASPLDVALQFTVRGCRYDRFLLFIEALRDNPERIEAYNALKRRWHGQSMREYRVEKSAFIESVLAGCATA